MNALLLLLQFTEKRSGIKHMRKVNVLNAEGMKILKKAKADEAFVAAYTEDGTSTPSFFSFNVDKANFVVAYSGWLAGIKHAELKAKSA
jgi:hypothetical protein